MSQNTIKIPIIRKFPQVKSLAIVIYRSLLIVQFIANTFLFSQQISLTTYKSFLLEKNLPFWLVSNRDGIDYNKANFSFSYFDKKENFEYGLTFTENFFQKAYLEYKREKFNIKIGKWYESISSESKGLSSGSLILSNNAKSIPKVSLDVSNYSPQILKKNNFYITGQISHGILDKGDYIIAPYMHLKSLYVKKIISKNTFTTLGIVHAAQWGGKTISHGKQPDNFSDYLRIFFLQPGSKNSLPQEKKNRLGNHLGIWDLTIDKKINNKLFRLYYQHPFEDQSGAKWLINRFDGLYGIEISNSISNFLYEYINTTNQSGSSGASDSTYGWDNYYNHYIYQSGWTHMGRVIANPLFTLGSNSDHYSNLTYVVNNRIKAHHLGLSGKINKRINYKALITYSSNFGIYPDQNIFNKKRKPYLFKNGLIQRSGMLELELNNIYKNINIIISYAFDNGDLLNESSGFLFYINYNISKLSASN